ncbi:MAG TPA: hypothetical protein VEX86_26810 [Longimicrobium sp.]|nr:hypothetical protein [Longimicrobium sp.]
MKEFDYTDPVLEEIWAVRDRLAAEVGYDLEKLGRLCQEHQKQYADELIPAPKPKNARRPAA